MKGGGEGGGDVFLNSFSSFLLSAGRFPRLISPSLISPSLLKTLPAVVCEPVSKYFLEMKGEDDSISGYLEIEPGSGNLASEQ